MTGIKKLCILLLTETFKSCLRFEIYNRIRKLSGGYQMRLLLAEDEKELSSFWSFLVISIVGILVVFALVLIFSKIAVKPFAESYEKRKRFITDASHEIKTPLTIIEANRMQ